MLNVGIIGAGEGGTSILKTLLSVPEVNVIGVCDLDQNTPGIKMAKKKNIPVFKEIKNIMTLKTDKLIIEVTGNKKVKSIVEEMADKQTTIVDSAAALLISKIVSSREVMINKLKDESTRLASLAGEIGATIQETTATNEKNINNLNKSVEKLNSASNESQTNIKETNQIINFIKDVADQTKMLGLNAAIEAARADHNARGFTVVANEIRKLADETGQSVNRITHFTEELNTSVKNTLDSIDKMDEQVESFTDTQNNVSDTLNKVASQIKNMSENLSELSSS